MLAYVFWHWPAPGVDAHAYREALLAFHEALAEHPSPGLAGSRVWAIAGAPWLPVVGAYEDWYLVDTFEALGWLNDAAVTGPRRDPHQASARLAGGGAGGLYRRLAEGREPAGVVTWLPKPAGASYADFVRRVPAGVELWQRQLVLGPAPEFWLAQAPGPGELGGVGLPVERVR